MKYRHRDDHTVTYEVNVIEYTNGDVYYDVEGVGEVDPNTIPLLTFPTLSFDLTLNQSTSPSFPYVV